MIKICGYKTIIGKRRLMATTMVPEKDAQLIQAKYEQLGYVVEIG